MENHGPNSTVPNKSKFNNNFDIKKGIKNALTSQDLKVTPTTNGRSLIEYTYKNSAGKNSNEKPVSTIRVVVDKFGNVITAYLKNKIKRRKMGLDFYIAKSKDIVSSKKMITEFDDFVSLHEELQDYIYTNSSFIDFEINCLIDIDPYDDTLLEYEKIAQIIKICKSILESNFFQKYEDIDDAINIFSQLDKICEKAISENKNLIAIGD